MAEYVYGEKESAEAQLSGTSDFSSNGLPAASAAGAGVQWKSAVLSALVVSVAAGLLSILGLAVPALSALCFFWVVSGSLIALGLYQRRIGRIGVSGTVPVAALTPGVGARIGLLVGIFTAFAIATVTALALLLGRYAFHMGPPFDAQLTAIIREGMRRAAQNGSDSQLVQNVMTFWLSPEGRAGYILLTTGVMTFGIVILCMIAGAIGARIVLPSRRTAP